MAQEQEVLRTMIRVGTFSLYEVLAFRRLNQAFKKFIDERILPDFINAFADYIVFNEPSDEFKKFCLDSGLVETWKKNPQFMPRLLVAVIENDKSIIINNAQEFFDALVFSIPDTRQANRWVSVYRRLGIMREELTALSVGQHAICRALTRCNFPRNDSHYYLEKVHMYANNMSEVVRESAMDSETPFLCLCVLGNQRTLPFYVNFYGANLLSHPAGLNLCGVSLAYSNLSRTVLGGIDFTDANLTAVNFYEASLNGAKLSGAKLTNAKNLSLLTLLNIAPLTKFTDFRHVRIEGIDILAPWKYLRMAGPLDNKNYYILYRRVDFFKHSNLISCLEGDKRWGEDHFWLLMSYALKCLKTQVDEAQSPEIIMELWNRVNTFSFIDIVEIFVEKYEACIKNEVFSLEDLNNVKEVLSQKLISLPDSDKKGDLLKKLNEAKYEKRISAAVLSRMWLFETASDAVTVVAGVTRDAATILFGRK